LPVEVLSREEIEKVVEEKLKKLLSETEISKKIAELESSTAKLRDDIARLSAKEAAVVEPEPVAAALTRDLAERADLLQVEIRLGSVTLKPKRYLAQRDFRAIAEAVKKYGGFWSSQNRTFIIRKRG
jgi:uncharacterized small protein (DUF1192 family)